MKNVPHILLQIAFLLQPAVKNTKTCHLLLDMKKKSSTAARLKLLFDRQNSCQLISFRFTNELITAALKMNNVMGTFR